MTNTLRMVGLDIGTTTSRFIVITATPSRHPITKRPELQSVHVIFHSPSCFTPFVGQALDTQSLETQITEWVRQSQTSTAFASSALITGLAAKAPNTLDAAEIISRHLPGCLIVRTADPHLESWLAFMGNCHALSCAHPQIPILNFDIGGGTTNVTLGINGSVLAVGCYWIGARHVRLIPGTYTIAGLSEYGIQVFSQLGISKTLGEKLDHAERDKILAFYTKTIETIVTGDSPFWDGRFNQVSFSFPSDLSATPFITFSGGVGELVYAISNGDRPQQPTPYGDLGVDLATGILASPILAPRIHSSPSFGHGQATVLGLCRHHVSLSGTSIYLPNVSVPFPISEIPVLGRISPTDTHTHITHLVQVASRMPQGACLMIRPSPTYFLETKKLGVTMGSALTRLPHQSHTPLVLVMEGNMGKTLGNYITQWNQRPFPVIVIDEIPLRTAQFITLGVPKNNTVPVVFYGLQ